MLLAILGIWAVVGAYEIQPNVTAPIRPWTQPPPSQHTSKYCRFDAPRAPLPSKTVDALRNISSATANLKQVRLSWDAYMKGAELPQNSLFVHRDLKGSEAPPSKVLVFIGASGRSCQLVHLQGCWPPILQAAPLLGSSDVLLYAGVSGRDAIASAALWADALVRLPSRNVSLAWVRWNPGYQEGAMAAMVVGTRRGWFSSYEWVVRANPDVLVVDSGPLEKAMQASNTDAVLYVCKLHGRARKPGKKGWTEIVSVFVVHTDFFAARPEAMNASGWGQGIRVPGNSINAEASATLVFRATMDAGRATLWHGAARKCRVHAQGVAHSHEHCIRKPALLGA